MEDEIHYGEQSHVHNTDGCDVHFNDQNEELIPVKLSLTKNQIRLLNSLVEAEMKAIPKINYELFKSLLTISNQLLNQPIS